MELDSSKVIRASYEAQPFVPFNALSVFRDPGSILHERVAAVGCSAHVLVTRLDKDISEMFSLSFKSAGILDVLSLSYDRSVTVSY